MKEDDAAERARAFADSLEAVHATLVAYLRAMVDEGDWHGVSDAANDLRVLEAKMER